MNRSGGAKEELIRELVEVAFFWAVGLVSAATVLVHTLSQRFVNSEKDIFSHVLRVATEEFASWLPHTTALLRSLLDETGNGYAMPIDLQSIEEELSRSRLGYEQIVLQLLEESRARGLVNVASLNNLRWLKRHIEQEATYSPSQQSLYRWLAEQLVTVDFLNGCEPENLVTLARIAERVGLTTKIPDLIQRWLLWHENYLARFERVSQVEHRTLVNVYNWFVEQIKQLKGYFGANRDIFNEDVISAVAHIWIHYAVKADRRNSFGDDWVRVVGGDQRWLHNLPVEVFDPQVQPLLYATLGNSYRKHKLPDLADQASDRLADQASDRAARLILAILRKWLYGEIRWSLGDWWENEMLPKEPVIRWITENRQELFRWGEEKVGKRQMELLVFFLRRQPSSARSWLREFLRQLPPQEHSIQVVEALEARVARNDHRDQTEFTHAEFTCVLLETLKNSIYGPFLWYRLWGNLTDNNPPDIETHRRFMQIIGNHKTFWEFPSVQKLCEAQAAINSAPPIDCNILINALQEMKQAGAQASTILGFLVALRVLSFYPDQQANSLRGCISGHFAPDPSRNPTRSSYESRAFHSDPPCASLLSIIEEYKHKDHVDFSAYRETIFSLLERLWEIAMPPENAAAPLTVVPCHYLERILRIGLQLDRRRAVELWLISHVKKGCWSPMNSYDFDLGPNEWDLATSLVDEFKHELPSERGGRSIWLFLREMLQIVEYNMEYLRIEEVAGLALRLHRTFQFRCPPDELSRIEQAANLEEQIRLKVSEWAAQARGMRTTQEVRKFVNEIRRYWDSHQRLLDTIFRVLHNPNSPELTERMLILFCAALIYPQDSRWFDAWADLLKYFQWKEQQNRQEFLKKTRLILNALNNDGNIDERTSSHLGQLCYHFWRQTIEGHRIETFWVLHGELWRGLNLEKFLCTNFKFNFKFKSWLRRRRSTFTDTYREKFCEFVRKTFKTIDELYHLKNSVPGQDRKQYDLEIKILNDEIKNRKNALNNARDRFRETKQILEQFVGEAEIVQGEQEIQRYCQELQAELNRIISPR